MRYTLPIDGRRMHVMEIGEGRPVLMLHGNPTWGFLYRKVVAALEGEPLRIVLPDLFGLGFSDRIGAGAHRLADHGRWVGACIDALGLEELIFVGQDWGGPIGLLALADRPEKLAGLVLLNTVVGPPRQGFRPTAFHRFSQAPLISSFAFRVLGFPQVALHIAQGDKASIRGEVARAYRFPLRGTRRNAAPLALARMVPNSMAHPSVEPLGRCQALVEGFSGPASIVWGDRDPVLGRLLRRTQRLLPDAESTVTRAGHFLQEEVPEEIAAAVRSVVARL